MLENKARNDNFSYSIWDMILFEATKQQDHLTMYHNTVMYDCETEGSRITAINCVQETTEMQLPPDRAAVCGRDGQRHPGLLRGAAFRAGVSRTASSTSPTPPKRPITSAWAIPS